MALYPKKLIFNFLLAFKFINQNFSLQEFPILYQVPLNIHIKANSFHQFLLFILYS